MKMSVFAVYDEKAQAYANPFYFNFKGEAVRAFQDIATDPKSIISKHISDFSLYMLGTFDDRSGQLESLKVPEFIIKAVDFKPAVEA